MQQWRRNRAALYGLAVVPGSTHNGLPITRYILYLAFVHYLMTVAFFEAITVHSCTFPLCLTMELKSKFLFENVGNGGSEEEEEEERDSGLFPNMSHMCRWPKGHLPRAFWANYITSRDVTIISFVLITDSQLETLF